MHSYIVVGKDEELIGEKVGVLTKKLKSASMSFALAKIADVRELNSFTRLSIDKPTSIIIENIDKATHETLNAFLKNLEEPQENISYILTCSSVHGLLPTIVSRCQIISVGGSQKKSGMSEVKKFLNDSTHNKLEFVGKIKDRGEAIDFVEKVVMACHELLHKSKPDYQKLQSSIESANLTLKALNANGNVALQLTNLVINL